MIYLVRIVPIFSEIQNEIQKGKAVLSLKLLNVSDKTTDNATLEHEFRENKVQLKRMKPSASSIQNG